MDKSATCEQCKHFRQHYIKFGSGYRKISYGHCVYPKLKKRDAAATACEHYKPREQ